MPVIFLSIVINYICGRLSDREQKDALRKMAVAGAIVCNLLLLFVFKYLGFLTENLHQLFPGVPVKELILPIGISFYTFQGLSYVIDVFRGEVKAERNLFRIALYIALFPQLVAGPIVRYTTIAGELRNRQESWENFEQGVIRFLFGLAKKVLLANSFAQIADSIFAQASDQLSTSAAWLGVVAYTLQIYFDFSGYSDMAIGLGRIFGFHFLENFNYPYIAISIKDFWRRWHISLSTWFRDYVYIPLGGEQRVERKASPKSSHCMGVDRFLAWCSMDLPFVGNLLCSAFDWGALYMGGDSGKTSQGSTTCLCAFLYPDWLVNFSSGRY